MKTKFVMTFEAELEDVPETLDESSISINILTLKSLTSKIGSSQPVYNEAGEEVGQWKIEALG